VPQLTQVFQERQAEQTLAQTQRLAQELIPEAVAAAQEPQAVIQVKMVQVIHQQM
jgi:hypothetical protein